MSYSRASSRHALVNRKGSCPHQDEPVHNLSCLISTRCLSCFSCNMSASLSDISVTHEIILSWCCWRFSLRLYFQALLLLSPALLNPLSFLNPTILPDFIKPSGRKRTRSLFLGKKNLMPGIDLSIVISRPKSPLSHGLLLSSVLFSVNR